MVTWTINWGPGQVFHLCDAHGRKEAAIKGLRLPLTHEQQAATRIGHGRSAYIVRVSRAPQTDDWLYNVRCADCAAPEEA
jgi:hypothetical protein